MPCVGEVQTINVGGTVTMRDLDGDTFRAWLRYPKKKRPGQWGGRARRLRHERRGREWRKAIRHPRWLRRWLVRSDLEVEARDLGLVPCPGESSKHLRARIAVGRPAPG